MEMFLQKASESDIANKIKADKDWLNKERLDYIVSKRPEVFHYLKPEDVDQDALKTALKTNKTLLAFAEVAQNQESWKDLVSESIPRPLTNNIFKNYGVLLHFLEEKEYAELATEWVNKTKSSDFIPREVQKFLDEKKVLNILKYDSTAIAFDHLSDEVKTLKVCLAFMENQSSYLRHRLYKSLPKEIQDDPDIAYLVCYSNKQFYKELTPKAKCNEKVISRVIDDVIPSQGDHDWDRTDETAIHPKELSQEAILCIKSPYTIRDIFRKAPKFMTDKIIQEKWLGNEEHQEALLEFYDYFTEENKENFKNKIQKQGNWEKALALFDTPKLRNLLIDESDVKGSLEILIATHMNARSFEKALKQTGLQNLFDKNLEAYAKQYTDNYDNYHHKRKVLELSDWLVKQGKDDYKQVALNLLSVVLKKDPNALDVDFEYHYDIKSNALKKIASEVYEYMDNQQAQKPKKKKM